MQLQIPRSNLDLKQNLVVDQTIDKWLKALDKTGKMKNSTILDQ